MKRAEEKSPSPEIPVTKVKKLASVKIASKKLIAPEPSGVTKTKKTASAKVPELKKAAIIKKQVSAVEEKPAKKKVEIFTKKLAAAPQLSKTAVTEKKTKPIKEKIEAKVKSAKRKVVIPTAAKKTMPKSNTIKPEVSPRKAKTVEKEPEIVIAPPVAPKIVKKKLKPIGSAVVRGRNGRYDFEVFSLDAEIKDGSAIYVISKRMTDKSGRGHHKFVCIGQTESLLIDLKKHAKGKCIKQHKANVICLLREESEKNRLKIETDLREAHTIACNHQ